MKTAAIFPALVLVINAATAQAQDADAGRLVFKKCAACHQIGDGAKNGAGPVLTGIIGRPAGSYDGFRYSKYMVAAGEAGHVWDEDSIFEYISNPTKYLRKILDNPRAKAKMHFKLKSEEDRRNVIAYLATFQTTMGEAPEAMEQMTALPSTDTPGRVCVTNGTAREYLFIVEIENARINEMLGAGMQLCADSDQGGKISVFENPDDQEGCTRIMAPNKSDTLVRYMDFDRCFWGTHIE
ncbi:c-type cytochrome [Profundibacter sp.]